MRSPPQGFAGGGSAAIGRVNLDSQSAHANWNSHSSQHSAPRAAARTRAALSLLAVWIGATTLMNLPASRVSWFSPSAAPLGRTTLLRRGASASFSSGRRRSSLLRYGGRATGCRHGSRPPSDSHRSTLSAAELQPAVLIGIGLLLVTNCLSDLAQLVVAGLQLPEGFVPSAEMLSTRSGATHWRGHPGCRRARPRIRRVGAHRLIRGLRNFGAKDGAREA